MELRTIIGLGALAVGAVGAAAILTGCGGPAGPPPEPNVNVDDLAIDYIRKFDASNPRDASVSVLDESSRHVRGQSSNTTYNLHARTLFTIADRAGVTDGQVGVAELTAAISARWDLDGDRWLKGVEYSNFVHDAGELRDRAADLERLLKLG